MVLFEGTSYQDVFDESLIKLKEYADRGAKHFGWRSDNDDSKFGQYNDIELTDNQKYRIVDRTEKGDKGITLDIRHDEGIYVFTGRGKYNVRAIDIHDARTEMKNVNQVMEEIKTIVKAASED